MTLPAERTQSVLRARDFLLSLTCPKSTPGVPLQTREKALAVLRHFPTACDMECPAEAFEPHAGQQQNARDDDTEPRRQQ